MKRKSQMQVEYTSDMDPMRTSLINEDNTGKMSSINMVIVRENEYNIEDELNVSQSISKLLWKPACMLLFIIILIVIILFIIHAF